MSARKSRERKVEQIKQLEGNVRKIRCRKTELIQEHDRLLLEQSRWTGKVKRLQDSCGHPPTAQMVGNVESYDMDSSSVISGLEQKEHCY